MNINLNKTAVLGSFGNSAVKVGRYHSPLRVKVEILIEQSEDGPRLSICGEVGRVGARDVESCGQIDEEVRRLLADPDARLNYPAEKVAKLLEVWDRWHLNDCHGPARAPPASDARNRNPGHPRGQALRSRGAGRCYSLARPHLSTVSRPTGG